MAAPPRAAPATIDNATVYRVFMMSSHSPAEHQRPERKLCFARVKHANQNPLRHAAIGVAYRPLCCRVPCVVAASVRPASSQCVGAIREAHRALYASQNSSNSPAQAARVVWPTGGGEREDKGRDRAR